eukprot:2726980-Prymnesium_polylepis.1
MRSDGSPARARLLCGLRPLVCGVAEPKVRSVHREGLRGPFRPDRSGRTEPTRNGEQAGTASGNPSPQAKPTFRVRPRWRSEETLLQL